MTRTCPHCGFTEDSSRERCSRCGRSVFAPAPRLTGRRRRQAQWIGGAALLAVAAAFAAVLIVVGAAQDRHRRAAEARAVSAERARLTRVQTPHRGAAPDLRPPAGADAGERLAARAALVRRVEARITRDAQARVRTGELKGPIGATACGPFGHVPDAVPDDRVLSKAIGRYECVASKGAGANELGYPFVTALDFDRFTFVWCRNNPAQGEAGQSLAFVRLARPCLAAKGRPLGTGYADVPGS